MMEEIWKPIKGFEGLYEVSNIGRVRRVSCDKPFTRNGKVFKKHFDQHIMKFSHDRDGYSTVGLSSFDGKKKLCKVHRLVAEVFVMREDDKNEIDHINTIKDDNRADNLRWVTVKENANNPITLSKRRKFHGPKHRHKTSRHITKEHIEALIRGRMRKVNQYTKDGEFVASYDGPSKASIALCGTNRLRSQISCVCRGKRKSIYGYIWKYAND